MNLQQSAKFVKTRELMVEIEALRALVDEKGDNNNSNQAEVE